MLVNTFKMCYVTFFTCVSRMFIFTLVFGGWTSRSEHNVNVFDFVSGNEHYAQ